jgi:hypothetical protein
MLKYLLLLISLIYFIEAQEWTLISTTGTLPPPSSGYIAVKLGTTVVKYGGGIQGTGPNNTTYFAQTHLFDLITDTWTAINNTSPIGRMFAAAVSLNETHLLMYGGAQYFQVPLSVTIFDEYWLFDLTTTTWTQIFFTGTTPTPRFEHGMVYDAENNNFYVWGGEIGNNATNLEIVGDMYKCSMCTLVCELVIQIGDIPVPRVNLKIRNLNEKKFIASGGFSFTPRGAKSGLFIFNIKKNKWTREEFDLYNPEEKGRFPTPRESAVFDIVDDIIVIWGGDVDGSNYYNLVNDTWSRNLERNCGCGPICKENIWQYQDIPSPIAAKRVESIVYDGAVYTFGGLRAGGFIGPETATNEVYKYTPCS